MKKGQKVIVNKPLFVFSFDRINNKLNKISIQNRIGTILRRYNSHSYYIHFEDIDINNKFDMSDLDFKIYTDPFELWE